MLLRFDKLVVLDGREVLNDKGVIHWVMESCLHSFNDHFPVALVGEANKELSNLTSRQICRVKPSVMQIYWLVDG